MIKIEIFREKEDRADLEKNINNFCQHVTTKGSIYAKVHDIKCVINNEDDLIYTVVYDDGESERSAT